MSNRIQATFDQLKQQNRKALIPFVTAGDPSPELTVALLHTLVAAGAAILEGIPRVIRQANIVREIMALEVFLFWWSEVI